MLFCHQSGASISHANGSARGPAGGFLIFLNGFSLFLFLHKHSSCLLTLMYFLYKFSSHPFTLLQFNSCFLTSFPHSVPAAIDPCDECFITSFYLVLTDQEVLQVFHLFNSEGELAWYFSFSYKLDGIGCPIGLFWPRNFHFSGLLWISLNVSCVWYGLLLWSHLKLSSNLTLFEWSEAQAWAWAWARACWACLKLVRAQLAWREPNLSLSSSWALSLARYCSIVKMTKMTPFWCVLITKKLF